MDIGELKLQAASKLGFTSPAKVGLPTLAEFALAAFCEESWGQS
jgi:hypothetical protein